MSCLLIGNLSYAQLAKVDSESTPNIFIVAIMKSASEHIVEVLKNGLSYERVMVFSCRRVDQGVINSNMVAFFETKHAIGKQHFNAPNITIKAFKNDVLDESLYRKYSNKLVVHFRDPREVLLSWVHHLSETKSTGGFSIEPPNDFYNWKLQRKVDWAIEHSLPNLVLWTKAWMDYIEEQKLKKDGLQILVTTYDEFKKDELAFYKRILSFYNIPESEFTYQPIPKEKAIHFRKADSSEWRSVFTSAQKDKIANMVPDNVLQHFRWQA